MVPEARHRARGVQQIHSVRREMMNKNTVRSGKANRIIQSYSRLWGF